MDIYELTDAESAKIKSEVLDIPKTDPQERNNEYEKIMQGLNRLKVQLEKELENEIPKSPK